MTKYIYSTKFVNTPKEYIEAVKNRRAVIKYPKKMRRALLNKLKKVMDESPDLEYAYYMVLMDGRVNKDKQQEINEGIFRLANKGNIRALNGVGYIYDLGIGVEEDNTKALLAYKSAADQGDAHAMFNLGIFLEKEMPEAYKDPQKAAEYTLKAARLGHARAQYRYAINFCKDEDYKLFYLRKAAKQKYVPAYQELGLCLEDIDERIYWLKKAIKAGDLDSYCHLADIYAYKCDVKNALKYYFVGIINGSELAYGSFIDYAYFMGNEEFLKYTLKGYERIYLKHMYIPDPSLVEMQWDDYKELSQVPTDLDSAIKYRNVEAVKSEFKKKYLNGHGFDFVNIGKSLGTIHRLFQNRELTTYLFELVYKALEKEDPLYGSDLIHIPFDILVDIGEYGLAIKCLSLGLEECTQNTDPYFPYHLGLCYEALKEYKLADTYFYQAADDEDYCYYAHQHLRKIEKYLY